MALAMLPPPPPDLTKWCEDNIVFDGRSPMPGPFSIRRFPWLREIHEVLSPEHPAREVTVCGSAQIGKTVSLIQPCLGAWFAYAALDALVVHPTQSAATEWVDNKWLPMRRQAPGLLEIFGDGRGGDNKDAKFNQETVNRNGSLKVASSGSPADLTGTSRRLVVMDDLSKFEMTDKGDPEALAVSRASAFEDAKIFRVSTPLVKGTCRITKAFDRSDRRFYHVACPHCGNMAPLTWANFKKNIDPERLHAAHFTCEACGCVITHADKEAMIAGGVWVRSNAGGDHPGFHLWRAYAPQRDWASIAVDYAQVMGWSGLTLSQASEDAIRKTVEAETEQTFWNDVLGLPFEQASKGPDWEALRDRVENAEPGEVLDRGIVPACGVLLTAGVDCQADRIEVTICAYGQNYRRWVVDHVVIPFYIGDEDGRDALDGLMKASWRTELGLRLPLDMMAIDEGAFTEDVRDWAKRYPLTRLILIKGSSTASGPMLRPQSDRKANGKIIKRQKRGWMLNVSQMKADFYGWLAKTDPQERGFVGFARGLGDEYFRQITSEVRVLKRAASGVMVSRWELVEPTRRNECLDTMNYSEAAARKRGWTSAGPEYWATLQAVRGAAPAEGQADLFDVAVPLSQQATPTVPREQAAAADAPRSEPAAPQTWIKPKGKWL
jgi:phage terminase large subunit GpA-like protein